MRAVFDTNILIDYLNGISKAVAELALYDDKLISIITYIETLTGAKNREQERLIQSFLSTFAIRPLSPEIADRAVLLRREQRLKTPDAIVYATARTEGCLIVSRNSKDLNPDWPDVRMPYVV